MPPNDIHITDPTIEQYLLAITPQRDTILAEMESYAAERNFPIVGPLVGRMLFALAASINATKILELGSGFGYSAYWFAQATQDDAKIVCTENSAQNVARANDWLKRGNVRAKVELRLGNALDVLPTLDETFDIIFNDIDKHDYPKALHMSVPKLRIGGLFITDNVLWKGRILHDTPDETTARIIEFNRMLYSTPQLFTTIIPLRDGVSVSIKLP